MRITTKLKSPLAERKDLLSVHLDLANKTRETINMPEFLKMRTLVMRKQVQVAIFSDVVSLWDEMAYKFYGKSFNFYDHRELILEIIKKSFVPPLEKYYRCSITNFYMFEPYNLAEKMYGFTAKLFSAPLFKSIDAHHAPMEEKLAADLSACLRQLYGRGPGHTTAALLDNRFLVFVVTDLLTPFTKTFAETHTDFFAATISMLKVLLTDAVNFVCRQHYGKTYESFVEIDVASNQLIALILIDPLINLVTE